MFTKSNHNVTFQDVKLDDYILENSVLKSKLQSKTEALLILNKELDTCRMEKDKYKMLVEQLKHKKTLSVISSMSKMNNLYRSSHHNFISGEEMLASTRDQNNHLKLEVETLQNKLEEALSDIEALRKQLHRKNIEDNTNKSLITSSKCSIEEYECLIEKVEKYQNKYQQSQLDFRIALDEKEEIESDRDYYKQKVQRLNQQIHSMLANRMGEEQNNKTISTDHIDCDAIIKENKYLQERITQMEIEKDTMKRTLAKYKALLENKNNQPNRKKGFLSDVVSQKQVRAFLEGSTNRFKDVTPTDLKSLCRGLFDAFNDKSIALQHQRRTNVILANRIAELELTLNSWYNGQKVIPAFPSKMLLQNCDSMEVIDEANNKNGDYLEVANQEQNCQMTFDKDMEDTNSVITPKTVLPIELEELVKEALAELKS